MSISVAMCLRFLPYVHSLHHQTQSNLIEQGDYNFAIIYRSGSKNADAYGLSICVHDFS